MAENTQSVQAIVDQAIVPLNQVRVADLSTGAAHFDAWLREYTGGYVTLERVKDVSAGLPVLGNIMAAVDVCGDIATLVKARNVKRSPLEQALDWASLGINLIGVMPLPPGTAAARMSLRPTLGIVRAAVKTGAKDLGMAIVGVIAGHFTATLAGELKPFVEQAKARLPGLLEDCGNEAEKHLNALADALEQLAHGQLSDPNVNLKAAGREIGLVSGNALVHSPLKTIDHLFTAVWEVNKAAVKTETNAAAHFAVTMAPAAAPAAIQRLASELRDFVPVVKRELHSLSGEQVGSIMYMLNILMRAIQVYEDKKHRIEATVKSRKATQAQITHAGGEVEVRRDEVSARKPGTSDCLCKIGQPPVATAHSIGFALGDERLSHTDFTLPGILPLEWVRAYRSNFGAHDSQGPLGPRWTTPFHASFEADDDALVYHDASGRSLEYPSLGIGKAHHDAIEQCTITRVSDAHIRIARGASLTELYERHGERFVLTEIADRDNHAITLTYSDGRLATIASSAGPVSGFTHDAHGRITHIALLDDAGHTTRTLARYLYDDAGDLVEAIDEDGAARRYAYSHHLITRYTDRTGRGMNLQWNGTHLDAKAIREWADDGSFDTRLEWHERLRLTFVTDALGRVTQQYYDIDGYPYRVVHPDKTEEWFFRDAARNVTRRIHADGGEENFTWDARGNLTSHTTRDGRTAHFVYDAADNLTGTQDPEGHRWERHYDNKGRVTEATDPLGRVTKYEYDRAGLPVAVIDPKGGRKQIAWRADGQIASYTDCSGKTSAWQYDERGRLVAMRNAAGETTRYEYEAGQLVALVRADQTREVFSRDAEGRLLTHTDALDRQTHYRYTAAGLLHLRTNARGDELAYIWNPLGQITGLRNENGREYRFEYDAAGRLVSETGFDGKTTRYFRDARSGVVTNQFDGDVMQALDYDAMGRLARRRGWAAQYTDRGQPLLGPQGDVKVDVESFAYDGLGRLLQATNRHARVQRFYDPVGNLEQELLHMLVDRESRSFAWRHEYDELDVRIATVRPDGHRLDWLTYGSGHVHGLMFDGQRVADFERDDAHRETVRELGNGLTQATAYDAAGRLAHQVLQGTGAKLLERRYRYDVAGQLEQIDDMRRGAIAYAYDPIGRLTRAQSALGIETFAFDPASNLLEHNERDEHGIGLLARDGQRTQPALLDNLLKDYAGTHYEHDARGNLGARVSNGERTVFGWDSFNRMVSARDRRMQATYVYDALGRRIAKLTEPQVQVPPMAGSGYAEMERQRLKKMYGYGLTLYGWDGDTLGYETSWEERSTTHYVYEPGSFVPLLQATTAVGVVADERVSRPQAVESVAYYHCDQIGTPLELSDAGGELVWTAHYKAWGLAKEVVSEAARKAGVRNPLRFQGQYYDDETGLSYSRYRYYDPHSGRFISKDPIGLAGGINVYQYAPNPVEWIDPFGLSKTPVGVGRKQPSSKANQNAKCPCRGKWEVSRFDRLCSGNVPGVGYAKYARDPGTGMWWSEDQTGHGNSAWKVYDKNGAWVADADVYGDYMNKHKSDTGKNIDFDSLKCKDSK